MRKRYYFNKNSIIGTSCICPSCGTVFIKTHYNQIFCRSQSGTKCKDWFWNTRNFPMDNPPAMKLIKGKLVMRSQKRLPDGDVIFCY